MKQIRSICLLLLGFSLFSQAQNLPKQYVMVEHFTNTYCSLCPPRNASLEPVLAANAGDVHHLRVHPSVPYNSCPLYNHNTTDNESRRNFFGTVSGTPRVYLNGNYENDWGGGNPIVSQSTFDNYLGATSPIGIEVVHSGTNVTVNVVAYDAPPVSSNHKLFIAVVEEELTFAGNNGETEHSNTLRDLLNPVGGQSISLPQPGLTSTYSYSYSNHADWDVNEIYIMAWIQDSGTKQVVNSGTSMDPPLPDLCLPTVFVAQPQNLYHQVNLVASTITLNWDLYPNAKACMLYGNNDIYPIDVGFFLGDLNTVGHPTSKTFALNTLDPNATYRWRIICGCNATPVIASPFSSYKYFQIIPDF